MEMNKIGWPLMIFCTTLLMSCNKGDCMEKEKNNCLVTHELNPVCGCNGVTYDNPSTAECNNIPEYTIGACK